MKRINKISVFSVLSSSVIVATPLMTSCSNGSSIKEYHILDFNDLHGAIPGYGEDVVDVPSKNPGCLRMARDANKILKQYPGSIFVSAGDENAGEAWDVCDNGATTYPVLKSMGVRYAAVGNHAFEWGLDDMSTLKYDKLARTDETKGNYFLAANILNTNLYHDKDWCYDPSQPEFENDYNIWSTQRVKWADPYKVIQMGDAKVCLIGLTTRNTLIDGNKSVTQQLSFADYNASINYTKYTIKKELGEREFNKIDSFILLTHIDSDYKNNELTGEAVELAKTVDTNIDAIISAHSHKTGSGKIWNNKLNKAICVGQSGTAGVNLLDTKLEIDSSAPKGKRLSSISMEVKPISVPKTADEAIQDWNNLLNSSDPDIAKVAKAYNEQKEVVKTKVNEVIATNTLDPSVEGDTQPFNGKNFDGYLNTCAHSSKQIGHNYFGPTEILDHLGGWINRANMIGFGIHNWADISENKYPLPSVSFTSQDSAPKELVGKDIKLRGMFDIQPHANTEHYGYFSITQLANIFNYTLAGDPEFNPDAEGFNYEKRYCYKPDLNFYKGYDKDATGGTTTFVERTALDQNDAKRIPVTTSAFSCGPMSWYGVKVELKEITSEERALEFEHPITGKKTPYYDPSAKYRVNTKELEITEGSEKGKKVILPVMWVYDGSTLNFGSIDNPSSWHDAKWWYEKEHPTKESGESVKLIPFIMNSFNYKGGNEQFKMVEPYAQYSYLIKGFEFYGFDITETYRDLITSFCRYSIPDPHEWTQFTIPTNIRWDVIKNLKTFA